ncbi:dihydrolipoamide acetyltransferase family protein [Lyngbya confervoides]|uniref:Dihydrolipoamide acetyltransferase component of pyruvate dehydrogenase complex n=1 Tax=Lyngbya confervoides BDU141951 TaxID=1574623 RepID=A0ABD4T1H0_9CYAN|nr:dihydrolipoamide acetyltransferase family protein [Lyngbya confervoides]MCM1982432.1 2-oxo acid dehydrogenase subunit E2 [Lyngbya confervoides BDU141951]
MIREVFMPALSSTMTEGKIVSWEKSAGDKVEKGETILVVESDKADMDVEAFYEGYLAAVTVGAGESAPVGATIALIAETEAEIEAAKQQAQSAPAAAATPTPTAPAPTAPAPTAPAPAPQPTTAQQNGGGATAAMPSSGRLIASPRAKKLAKQFKVDLSTVQGSGPHGRITAQDVESAAGQPTSAAAVAPPAPSPAAAPAAPPPVQPGEVAAFNTLQQAVVRNMMASLQVPTFHVSYAIVTDALDQLYQQVKSKGVTMTALLAKAVAVTLQKHPVVNAGYTDQGTHYNGSINIAVAVAMPDGGLITPVLQQADQVDLYSLSRSWKDLVSRARAKQLQPDEYSTGTFTLSNLGMFGVDTFDAILPPGQGTILAVAAARPTVVAQADGLLGVKTQMKVTITCDHRIIYGADAAAFLKDLADLIENNPQSLTL